MHLCMTKFCMETKIWKVMVDGICGSPLFMLNVINLDSEGSTVPREASKDFHYIGKFLSTLRADMAIGVWEKSSMML